MRTTTLVLDGYVAPSRNVLDRKHWAERARMLDALRWRVAAAFAHKKRFTKPVDVELRFCIPGTRLRDVDNLDGKLILDALKGRVFPDDSPKWVRSVTRRQELDNARPRVEVIVTEAE